MKQDHPFIHHFQNSFSRKNFVKLVLSKKRVKTALIKIVTLKPVQLKDEILVSMVTSNQNNDVTKNFTLEQSVFQLLDLLNKDFYKADLFTLEKNWHLIYYQSGKFKMKSKPATIHVVDTMHDHLKKRILDSHGNIYLEQLGITTKEGYIKKSKHGKYRQINKYVEIIDSILRTTQLPEYFNVIDMGAGKGYLTFALYDYLHNILKKKPKVLGVELRSELVEKCNAIAKKAKFDYLNFEQGEIKNAILPKIDVLIALHACDIATDDAIARGIKSHAKVILVAPCCHKQVRKSMKNHGSLAILTKFGIMEARQAEILTDTIRALILESYGYQTKVFEFIATDHTPKNILITALKTKDISVPDFTILEQVNTLKSTFGIAFHELEHLLEIKT
jgi:SAM-dependent methyltransferase